MNKQEAAALFHSMHPHFFAQRSVQSLSEDWEFEEMVLRLADFDPLRYRRQPDASVSFGFWEGDRAALLDAVAQVDPHWTPYFAGKGRAYCARFEGKPVSFCLVEALGTHAPGGQAYRIGGPACVGTLPAYRDRGIGLNLVAHVTRILRDEGYDYSYIHYTYVAPWYEKLGYETVLRWNKDGIL